MRTLALLSGVICLGFPAMAGFLRGDAGAETAALVKQLGADLFADREAASKGLEAIGEKALPAIRQAVAASDDLEVRQRGQRVMRAIMLACRKSKSLGLEMALIDPGEFAMGSPGNETSRRADEKQHIVRITQPFLLGAYEVTQDEYQKLMKTNPSWFASTGKGQEKVRGKDTSRYPVEKVTWFDAVEFCNRLSKQDGYEPYYRLADATREGDSIKSATVTVIGGNGFRLPTEAEWEYSCRARTTSPFHFGTASTGLEGNVRAVPATGYGAAPARPDVGLTTPVGSYKPNLWGLYDMHGNAGEWCADWYDRDYYGKSPAADPRGPETGTHRLLRGGSWLVSNGSCRSASRLFMTPDEGTYYTGFRVARSP